MITSSSNKSVKEVIQLEQKVKARREQGVFIAEGPKMFLEAPAEKIQKVYISESFYGQMPIECREKLDSIHSHYEIVLDTVFKKMSDTKTPQGILCVVEQSSYSLNDMFLGEAPLLVILEDIKDPGNLGTIFRSAEGAGVTGIIMSGGTADIYNPKSVRSTMGSVYRMPFIYTMDIKKTMQVLQERGVKIYAAHLQGSVPYDFCDYKQGAAFLIGNESKGLKEESAGEADVRIKILMLGEVESLNAAIAASLLFYEAARQRRS